ncbi:MAG TPA: hypothetical protein VFH68_20530 [Polyangia bacterium]|nr:hypothetical protein [Polyangia bacterium]
MLQRVAVGQVRFNLPGLAVDGRGVVAGRQLAVRFGAIDRLVSFFRLLSAEQSLDDLQPGLRILQARASAGTREAIVVLPAGSSHLAETAVRVARIAGGQGFTGNGKHFVQYRDARAPLGYDAAAISQDPGDLIFYGIENTVPYAVESELPLQKLLLRLSLQRQHGRARELDLAAVLYLTARRGLGPMLAEYFHRAQGSAATAAAPGAAGAGAATTVPATQPLRAAAALCDGSPDSAFQAGTAFWLFRLESVPPRMMGLLSGTPGLELFTPVGANVAVAYGYRHPIHLDACKTAFPGDRFFLFSPSEGGAMVLSPPPVFAAIEDLVRIRPPAPREPDPRPARAMPRPEFAVPLRLEPFPDYQRHAVATLVPWAQAGWLRRLCYTLPATALRGYRLAVLDRGLLLISGGVLDGIPFGTLLDFAAPNLLVPLGARLRPAVSPQILVERTGATGGAMVVFPALGEPPFRVPADAIEPLERRTLADADLGDPAGATSARRRATEPVERAAAPSEPVEIENDRLGPMPLWGIS